MFDLLAPWRLDPVRPGRRVLDFDPCTLAYFSNGEYLCVGGSDRKVALWTREGVRLNVIAEVSGARRKGRKGRRKGSDRVSEG